MTTGHLTFDADVDESTIVDQIAETDLDITKWDAESDGYQTVYRVTEDDDE